MSPLNIRALLVASAMVGLLGSAACTGTDLFRPFQPDADVLGDAGLDVVDAGSDPVDVSPDEALEDPIAVDAGPDGLDGGFDADTADSGDVDTGSAADSGPFAPTLYRSDQLRSPVTAWVADALAAIAAAAPSRQDDVFMKVGASGTESRRLLYCFAGEAQPQYDLDLGGRDGLMETITHFRRGDAAGDTPFDRPSDAAKSGMSAVWAISGDPSPLEREMAAVNPRYAFINYGTNDMQLGSTYQSALWPFYRNFTELLDETMAAGIIPIISGLNPRDDSASAARWVPTYDAVTRGVAQARQVPYINLYLATRDLPDMGLLSDGIHGNAYQPDGSTQPCVFTEAGLAYNYNVRNLLSIEALHQLRTVVFGEATPDESVDVLQGVGSPSDPFAIDELPFTHFGDTSASPNEALDAYPACDSGQDESGPEYGYRFTLSEETPMRIMVFDLAGIDVDVHLLSGTDAASCIARHDRIIQRTLPAGTYSVVVDTFVPSDGVPRDGEYLFAILGCEADDPACE